MGRFKNTGSKTLFIRGLFRGLSTYFHANTVIFKYRLWPWLFIPGILSIAYIFLLIIAGIGLFDDLSAYVNQQWMPQSLQHPAARFLTRFLLWIFLLTVAFISYKHVILILFAPILSQLSERTERLIGGIEPPSFSLRQMTRDFLRGMRINLRSLAFSLPLTFMAWLLIFIPVAGAILSTGLMFIIQAYYGGAGLVDYVLERRKFTVRDSLNFVKQNRGSVIGVGSGFILLLFIPVVGWFAAPAYGAIAGTLAAMEGVDEKGGQAAGSG